jgi:hypothetical protein
MRSQVAHCSATNGGCYSGKLGTSDLLSFQPQPFEVRAKNGEFALCLGNGFAHLIYFFFDVLKTRLDEGVVHVTSFLREVIIIPDPIGGIPLLDQPKLMTDIARR